MESKFSKIIKEAKSWGKIKDDGEAATVNGDVCITFPLMMDSALNKMKKEGFVIVGVKVPAHKRMVIKDFAKELCKKDEEVYG